MTKYFTLNNRRYEAKEFDFNMVCDLQEMGVDVLNISSLKKNPISAIRAYVSICMGGDKELAGSEIQAHIVDGGDFNEILTVMQEQMGESDFFQALNKGAEEETPEKKSAKKSEGNKKES